MFYIKPDTVRVVTLNDYEQACSKYTKRYTIDNPSQLVVRVGVRLNYRKLLQLKRFIEANRAAYVRVDYRRIR